ncbi:MAG TPA: 2-dehydro-3-deoxy-6-phosphogalactonate aldolase [Woeseiaceae bacterium]|nr:2-dehydro-3-deoxy-6-phosphogalactonate aldolase [Woeseiaceae bacterium]
MRLDDALKAMPVVAILRGVQPDEAVAVADVLIGAGIAAIEVPLNSPAPIASIERLVAACGGRAAIGAGTVLTPRDVAAVAAAGCNYVVAPDIRTSVVRAALALGLDAVPGIATPTEALCAVRAGARHLKLFPASVIGSGFVGALAAVLPPGVAIVAVGGITAANAQTWLAAGVAAIGTGSALYRPGRPLAQLGADAAALVRELAPVLRR